MMGGAWEEDRRDVSAGQQYLSVGEAEHPGQASNQFPLASQIAGKLPLAAINAGAAVVEAALHRPLYPLRCCPA